MECPRKHHHLYNEGYRPIVEPHHFVFGRMLHKALETDGPVTGDSLDVVIVEELVRGYRERWGNYSNVEWVEKEFRAPLPTVDLDGVHPEITLAGKMDLVLDDGTIVDHKTTSESFDDITQRLAMDSQIATYFLGAVALGVTPRVWVHDMVRKPGMRPLKATPQESRKYTKAGVLYANQRGEDETLEEFRLRLREDIAARPEDYFARYDVVRLREEVERHLANIWAWLPALDSRAQNATACHQYGQCPFFVACSTGTHPSDMPASFKKVDNVHPELNHDQAT